MGMHGTQAFFDQNQQARIVNQSVKYGNSTSLV